MLPDNKAKTADMEVLLQRLHAAENQFTYYSARGKLEYSDGSDEQNLGIHIVMEKDKYIWVSITGLLGIEGARMLMNKDSIMILDKLHSKAIIADYSYIKKMTNADLKLSHLQQIFLGNPPFTQDASNSFIDSLLNKLVLYTTNGNQKQTVEYNQSLKPERTIIQDQPTGRMMSIAYANPYITNGYAYPSSVNINMRAEKVMECKLTLTNFAFEKKKEVQFSIPKNYEVVKH